MSFIESKKETIQNFILFLIVIIVLLAAAEITCKIIFYDSTSNFGLGPGTFKFMEKHVALNADGMRDFSYNYTKNNGTIRIAVLGDSYAFGYGIRNVSNTFPKVLESRLNSDNLSNHYEVLNFGVPGYNTQDELNLLKNKAMKYNPDIIVVAYVLNDFQNLEPGLNFSGEFESRTLPGFFWFRQVSYFYFYMESQANIVYRTYSEGVLGTRTYEQALSSYYNSSENLAYNQKTFSELSNITHEKNIPVIVVVFPMIMGIKNYPFLHAHEVVSEMSAENNFSYIDLLGEYQKYSPSQLLVNRYDTHPNELGHRIASNMIYQKLENLNLLH